MQLLSFKICNNEYMGVGLGLGNNLTWGITWLNYLYVLSI